MLMPYLGNDTVYTKNKAAWRDYFKVLVEENRPLDGSDYAACQSLAPKLSATAHIDPPWTANYLLGVLHKTIKPNGDPSPVFRMAVIDLAAKRIRKQRRDKKRVYVPVNDDRERECINRIPPRKRLEILLAAAERE